MRTFQVLEVQNNPILNIHLLLGIFSFVVMFTIFKDESDMLSTLSIRPRMIAFWTVGCSDVADDPFCVNL